MKYVFENKEYEFPFKYYNPNPFNNNTNDCVIRSICGVTGKEWDDVLMELTSYALKYKLMINDPDLYEKYFKDNGWKKHRQPKDKDGDEYIACEWIESYKGIAIVHLGDDHMAMVKNGILYDTWCTLGEVVGEYWTIN